MYKKYWIITLTVIIMTILNPTYSDFKEFTGLTGGDVEHLHKKANFLILSIYENDRDNKRYLAILMNFIGITHDKLVDTTGKIKLISDSMTLPISADTSKFITDTLNIHHKTNGSSPLTDSELNKAVKESIK